MYKVIFDNGKPFEETFKNADLMKSALKKFYDENKDNDYFFDVMVFDEKGNDITESQFIEEMVRDILNEVV